MNWGYKILIVYGVFVLGILFMVVKSSSQQMDLVTTDYYEKELKYQDNIDEAARTSALSENIRYDIKDQHIIIVFPKDFAGKKITGKAALYCPADEKKDLAQDFTVMNKNVVLTISSLNEGQNELHINCRVDGLDYYFEKKIFIQQ
jgi:nitrogen fixation protein FixH